MNTTKREEKRTLSVPRDEHDAPVVRAAALFLASDTLDHVGELVDAQPAVVGVHVHVRCARVAPLEAVHGPEVALVAARELAAERAATAVGFPDFDAARRQLARVRRAAHEPQELLEHAAEEHALRGQQWETVCSREEIQ